MRLVILYMTDYLYDTTGHTIGDWCMRIVREFYTDQIYLHDIPILSVTSNFWIILLLCHSIEL